jgi:hypothetical protein
MSIVRVSADGLQVAARQLDHHAQNIGANCEPNDENPPHQATAAVVTATHARVTAISTVLASRIKAMSEKLDVVGHRYADTDDASASTLAE